MVSSSRPSPKLSVPPRTRDVCRRGILIVPQRYPCGVASGRGRSRQCGGGSCAGGRATRTCRSGTGRSCCRHGRTAYPVEQSIVRIAVFSTKIESPEIPSTNLPPRPPSGVIRLREQLSARCGTRGGTFAVGLDRRDGLVPCRGRSAGRRNYRRKSSFWRWLSIVVVGVASSEFRFQVDFRQILWCRLWDRAAL